MKVLIVRNFPNYMKVNNSTYNIQELGLASALVRREIQCDIVFWTDKNEEVINYKVPNSKGHINIYYKNAKKILLKNAIYNLDDMIDNYDIIQFAEYNQFQSLEYAMKYPQKVVIYHGQYYGKENLKYNIFCSVFDMLFLRKYLKKQTIFLTKSNLARDYLKKKGLKNVYTVGVGMNIDAIDYEDGDNNEAEFKTLENILKDKIVLLYVGEYMPRRHIKFIGNLTKKLNEEGFPTMLLTVGRTTNKYAKECNEYFEKNGISKYIEHIEKIEQKKLKHIYKLANYFIFPSTYEIFGMVLLEAMYFKVPVISSYNGGSSTLINNNNGVIIDNLDINCWKNKIIELHNNSKLYNDIANNSRDTIINNFLWDSIAEKFEKIYYKRLGENNEN